LQLVASKGRPLTVVIIAMLELMKRCRPSGEFVLLKVSSFAENGACDSTQLSPFFLFTAFRGQLHFHGIVYNQIHEFIETLRKLASCLRKLTTRKVHTRIFPSIRTAVCS
jgi:hypothetical protein